MELIHQQKRILVLAKDSRMLSVIDEILTYGDWDVTTIHDSNAIFDQARLCRPDLIILDYLLLNNHCPVICQALKDDPELRSVPVIVVTACKNKKVTADYFKCDALFIKPLDIQVLASRMDYLLAS